MRRYVILQSSLQTQATPLTFPTHLIPPSPFLHLLQNLAGTSIVIPVVVSVVVVVALLGIAAAAIIVVVVVNKKNRK